MFVLRPPRGRAKQDPNLEEEAGATIGARESNKARRVDRRLTKKRRQRSAVLQASALHSLTAR